MRRTKLCTVCVILLLISMAAQNDDWDAAIQVAKEPTSGLVDLPVCVPGNNRADIQKERVKCQQLASQYCGKSKLQLGA